MFKWKFFEGWNIYEIFFLNVFVFIISTLWITFCKRQLLDSNEHKRSATTHSGTQSHFLGFFLSSQTSRHATPNKKATGALWRCESSKWHSNYLQFHPPQFTLKRLPSLVIKKECCVESWDSAVHSDWLPVFLTGNLPTYSINQASVWELWHECLIAAKTRDENSLFSWKYATLKRLMNSPFMP